MVLNNAQSNTRLNQSKENLAQKTESKFLKKVNELQNKTIMKYFENNKGNYDKNITKVQPVIL